MKQKYCKTHFEIKGNFVPETIIEKIGVQPEKVIIKEDYCELHYGYYEQYDNVSDETISDILYQTIKPLINKDELLASLKEEYNLTFNLPIDTNAINLEDVLILDGKVTTFLYWSNTRKDLSWYFF